jgi:hypothetical protein
MQLVEQLVSALAKQPSSGPDERGHEGTTAGTAEAAAWGTAHRVTAPVCICVCV